MYCGEASDLTLVIYPGTTSFRPPKKYFVLFYLLSSPVVLVIALLLSISSRATNIEL